MWREGRSPKFDTPHSVTEYHTQRTPMLGDVVSQDLTPGRQDQRSHPSSRDSLYTGTDTPEISKVGRCRGDTLLSYGPIHHVRGK